MDFEKAICIISALCAFQTLAEPHDGLERNIYCDSCLATVKEIESLLSKVPNESREAAVKKLIDAVTCETVPFENGPSEGDMRTACKQLLEIYREHFSEAFLSEESKRLDILLCYEKTFTCVGVNRLKNKKSAADILAGDIEAFLRENKARVRSMQPVRVDSAKASKDEL